MESQIEKFNRRKQKTEALKKNKGVAEMSKENKTLEEQFAEAKKAWETAGLDPDDFPKEVTAENLNIIRQKIIDAQDAKKQTSENEKQNEQDKNKEDKENKGTPTEDKETPVTEATGEEKDDKTEDNKRQTLDVGTTEETPSPELNWIEEKRKFWKEYAESIENTFENDPAKDVETKTFSCVLSKDDKKGEIKYTAPDKVQVGKESHLEIYSGVVKDAVKNNLSITFGATLDDKQKALLLAACLMSKERYADGAEVAMVNPPKIDLNAEYFKQLPENVQSTLKEYTLKEQEKARQEEINTKLNDVRGRLNANAQEPKSAENIDKRYEIRKEQVGLMREKMSPEQAEARRQKEEEREKIMAARLGITGEYKTKNAKGEERIVKKINGLDTEKDDKGNLRISQEIQDMLRKKYGKEGK